MASSNLSNPSPIQEIEVTASAVMDVDIEEPDANWRYNPETITNKYKNKPFQVLSRLLKIVLSFAFFALGAWWHKTTGDKFSITDLFRRAIKAARSNPFFP